MSEATAVPAATITDSAASDATMGTTIATGLPAGVPKTSTTPEGATAPEGTAADQAAKPDEKPAVPEKYEFKLPEGIQVDTEALTAFEPIAKELGLSQEAAQKLVDLQVAAAARSVEAQKAQAAQWFNDVKADKDLGGQNFTTTAKNTVAAMDRFGDQALKDLLNTTGLGNHPAFVRWASKVGAAMAEDAVHPADLPAAPRKSTAEVMYDKTPSK